MTSQFAQNAISVTDFVGNVAVEATRALGTAHEISAFLVGAKFAASFVPGLSAVVGVLDVAEPIIQRIAVAAPILHRAIERGDEVVSLARRNGLLGDAKQLFAVAVNADPARPETDMQVSDVSDYDAERFVGSLFERSFFSPQDPRFANQSLG